MQKYSFLMVLFLMSFGCGSALTEKSDQGATLVSNSATDASPSESSDLTTACIVESVTNGVQITCGENVYLVENGEDGEDGATGPAGPQGSQGLQGIQGETGPSANLHLYDADDQDLGILIYGDGNNYTTYLSGLDVVVTTVSYSFRDSIVSRRGTANVATGGITGRYYFNSRDCTGDLYLEALAVGNDFWGLKAVYPMNDEVGGYYRIVPNLTRVDFNFNAISELDSDGCDAPENSLVEPFYPLEEIVLPFTEPLAWPLQIRLVETT